MKTIFTFFSIIIFSLVFVDLAKACTCGVSPPVNIAFQQTPNVAVLQITSLETVKNQNSGAEDYYLSKMSVKKVFKGNFKIGQEIIFKRTNTSCDYTFSQSSIGKEMLLYLGNKPNENGFWYFPACTRSDFLKNLTADVKYIENIDKVKGKTRLSGNISQKLLFFDESMKSEYKSLANKTLHIVGNSNDIEIKTDENGVYEIYDLPVGRYKVFLEPIPGYKIFKFNETNETFFGVEIKPKQHTEKDITYFVDNSISGKLFDSNGNPLKDVCLDVLPQKGKVGDYGYLADCTDKNGNFKIDEIPIGSFYIIVNDENQISADSPFGTFYYPNTFKFEEAKQITINAGEHIKDLVITAPTTAETITIKGKVLFENGIPKEKDGYEYVSVEFEPLKEIKGIDGESRAMIDENGNFILRVLKGQKGKFYAEFLTFLGDRLNCSKLDKILQKQGERSMSVHTNSIIIDGSKNLTNVVLKFPFPYCKKTEIE